MTDPFDQDELLLEDEWVELCDLEGHKASFRHLATIGIDERVYMILGAMRDGMDEPGALMLVREDETADGIGRGNSVSAMILHFCSKCTAFSA